MLEITEEGRATVATLEFAEEIRHAVDAFRKQGESELDIDQMCRPWIAIALTEANVELKDVTAAEAHQLARVMIQNADEIDCAFGRCETYMY